MDTARAWRMMTGPSASAAKIEAFAMALITTPCWANVPQKVVTWRLMEAPEEWTHMHACAWDAALCDSVATLPNFLARVGKGPPLPTFERRGGAPWSWLLQSRDLQWEVLAATKAKVWLRFTGTFDYVNGIEECRVGEGMVH